MECLEPGLWHTVPEWGVANLLYTNDFVSLLPDFCIFTYLLNRRDGD